MRRELSPGAFLFPLTSYLRYNHESMKIDEKKASIGTSPIAVVALGGNAIIQVGESGTIQQQQAHTRKTMQQVAQMIQSGYKVVMTHGNGPIVGNILIRNEAAKAIVPPMPLDICDADSEGGIGYMIQQSLYNEFHKKNITKPIVTLITQVLVDRKDSAFKNPTKPIGPFYNAFEAEHMETEKNWDMIEDSGRGYRRVVPSPQPLDIIEKEVIKGLISQEVVVIAAGGGGVPVEKLPDGSLRGVEAVVDKDRVASLMAHLINAQQLIILTSTAQVAIDYRKPTQRVLSQVGLKEIKEYYRQGQFPPGSMGPKIESIIQFLESGGQKAIITSPENLEYALTGRAGTIIIREA